jgi:hypothetical protein
VEGIACVDDAARAAVLYCTLWRRYGIDPARERALQLLSFLAYMQDADGRFSNFIYDWSGRKNLDGVTSSEGGQPWQARALHALAWATATFGGDEWGERFNRGLSCIDASYRHMDVRAVCLLAVIQHWQATGAASSRDRADAWATEIANTREGDFLVNAIGEEPIHLWGHLQEVALVAAGLALHRPELVEKARLSAQGLLLPAAKSFEHARRVLPFEVSCVVSGLSAVAEATGDVQYAGAADRARAWFHGSNVAGQPVYDRRLGVIYDGIDEGRVSRNAGAESNIEGALALLPWPAGIASEGRVR